MVRRGLVDSRTEAQEAITAGRVTVDGAPALKPSRQVHPSESVGLDAPPRRHVSRGGDKLAAALERFGVDPSGRRCLDAGASTGGFTDCLLQRGAAHVTAVDVGYGQIHQRLRDDERVTLLERTNARTLTPDDVPGPAPDLVVGDLSFISLRLVLPALRAVAPPPAEAVLLVKPQFEAGPDDVGEGGIVRDPATWRRVLDEVVAAARQVGWRPVGVMPSPLTGAAGNVEFLLHLADHGDGPADLDGDLHAAVAEAAEHPEPDDGGVSA
jgi:23S rRNA (cytidine1920-2'-O)/16S rRNA (cytidine1409-2'-O)-methyltransferase